MIDLCAGTCVSNDSESQSQLDSGTLRIAAQFVSFDKLQSERLRALVKHS